MKNKVTLEVCTTAPLANVVEAQLPPNDRSKPVAIDRGKRFFLVKYDRPPGWWFVAGV